MTGEQSAPTVLVADDGPVRVVTLNRPHRKNAIDLPLRFELADALENAAQDDGVRVIVLTGAGDVFCSGGDVSTMRQMAEDEARPRAEAAQRVIRAIWSTGKPVLAAVEGAAYGAGASLAMACDVVVAGRSTRISTAFTGVGLAGDMGIFASLPARVGPARARTLMLLPRPLSAEQACDWGIVDELVDDGTALEDALRAAHALAAGPARALAGIKHMLGSRAGQLDATLDAEIDQQVELFGSADFGEGVAAFAEKRPPIFTETVR